MESRQNDPREGGQQDQPIPEGPPRTVSCPQGRRLRNQGESGPPRFERKYRTEAFPAPKASPDPEKELQLFHLQQSPGHFSRLKNG